MNDFVDIHTHTIASGHAYNTLEEMLQAGLTAGLRVMGITEHAPAMPGTCHEFYFANYRVLPRERDGMRLMFGAEANVLDKEGTLDLSDELLRHMDVVIASLHPPCIVSGTASENTEALINAMRNPNVHIIGHPDDARFPLDYKCLIKAAKEYHVLLEVNNSSLSNYSYRPGARENYKMMLKLCERYGVPVLLGSDAHYREFVGDHRLAKELLEETGFPEQLVMNTDAERFLKFIEEKKQEEVRRKRL
ncbi:MAG: phosphatase [Lachnospiraceae bacterium]